MKRPKFSNLRYSLASAFLGCLLSAIGTLLGIQFDELKPVMPWLAAMAIGTCLVGIGVVAVWGVYTESAYRSTQLRAVESLPELFRFVKRRDTITIVNGAEVRYNSHVIVSVPLSKHRDFLYLPFEFDLGAGVEKFPETLALTKLAINGPEKPFDNAVEYRQIRQHLRGNGTAGSRHSVYGRVKIPVPLGVGYAQCNVEIEWTARNAFPDLATREFVYIDIPFVTDSLTVKVVGQGVHVRATQGPRERPLEAESYFQEQYDPDETQEENPKLREYVNAIEWRTKLPKVGYRYALYFQTYTPPVASGPPAQASSVAASASVSTPPATR